VPLPLLPKRVLLVAAAAAVLAPATPHTPSATAHVGCSAAALEAAVAAANHDPADATIDLDAGCVYTLTTAAETTDAGPNGLPVIRRHVVINGNGATITRSATGDVPAFRIFAIEDPAGRLTLNELMLRGGRPGGSFDGGAVLVGAGTLELNTSTITASAAGGSGGVIAVHGDGKLARTEARCRGLPTADWSWPSAITCRLRRDACTTPRRLVCRAPETARSSTLRPRLAVPDRIPQPCRTAARTLVP
jgi:hypothetical protein